MLAYLKWLYFIFRKLKQSKNACKLLQYMIMFIWKSSSVEVLSQTIFHLSTRFLHFLLVWLYVTKTSMLNSKDAYLWHLQIRRLVIICKWDVDYQAIIWCTFSDKSFLLLSDMVINVTTFRWQWYYYESARENNTHMRGKEKEKVI